MKLSFIFFPILFILLILSNPFLSHAEFPVSPEVEQARAYEEQCDKLNIRLSPAMLTDTSDRFIAMPGDYPDVHDFNIAKTPPTVDFGIIQGYEPWYLPIRKDSNYNLGGVWAGYGDVTRGPDNCYYFSIGDHRSYNGNAYIFRYDPAAKKHEILIDLKKVMGWTPDDYADGKIHGDLDIGPGGELWFLTYFGPFPTRREWDTVYRGSWLLHYNIFIGKVENLGIPLEGSSWPYYNYDWEREMLFAVAEEGGIVLAYDTKERKILYGGAPKLGISWHRRCTMLDHDTGKFYSTDTVTYPTGERYRGEHYFVSYTRRNNTFTRMNARVPANPGNGKPAPIRAHTDSKDADGAFWCFSENGAFFKFWPAEDRTELIGTNWGNQGYYTVNMCFSPRKRYIYYVPGVQSRSFKIEVPLVQYDTKTNTKKVIAFLGDFYLDKYGYGVDGPYGIEMDEKGESLFFYCGGSFMDRNKGLGFHRPAMFHVHIPDSERIE